MSESSKLTLPVTSSSDRGHGVVALGCFACLIQTLASTASMACAQALDQFIPGWQLNSSRFMMQVLCGLPVILAKRISMRMTLKRALTVGGVSGLFCLFNVAYYSSAASLPAGTISGIGRGLVILMSGLGTVVLTRTCRVNNIITAILCISGLILITQPPWMKFPPTQLPGKIIRKVEAYKPVCYSGTTQPTAASNYSTNQTLPSYVENRHSQLYGYAMLVLFAASLSAAMVMLNHVTKECDLGEGVALAVWVGIWSTTFSLILMAALETPVIPSTLACWGIFLTHGACLGLAGVLLFVVLQVLSPVVTSCINSMEIVFLVVLQYTVLSPIQPGHRNWEEILGVVLIILGNISGPGLGWLLDHKPK